MKQAYGTHKASKVSPQAGIGDMPENVISHILDCLPIKEAVRTGILSRNWRFNWTNISQLVFDEKFFEPGLDGGNNCRERTISRLLLHLKGVVTKFVLFIPDHKILDVEEVNRWVLFLSRKGIREFIVINKHPKVLKLPTHLFACLELKLLELRNCCFHVPPGFCGFPNLLNLDFILVEIKSRNIGEFISWCPLLEILKISYNCRLGKVKLVEIIKLENLKVLSLRLQYLENIAIKGSDIFELVGSLPKLQELYLNFLDCELAGGSELVPTVFPCLKTLALYNLDFGSSEMLSCAFGMIWGSPNLQRLIVTLAGVSELVSTVFPCLKTLALYNLDFGSSERLSCAFGMIWGSPNLQRLIATATEKDVVPPPSPVSSLECLEVHYTKIRKLQLQSVLFSPFRGSKTEVCLIKCILACSPSLKWIAIYPGSFQASGGEKGKLMSASKLLELPRASTIAEVKFDWSHSET